MDADAGLTSLDFAQTKVEVIVMAEKIIERGDLYFFYRPKVHEEKVRDLDDVQRFYIVMAPEEPRLFRLLIIGQKYMPEILPGRMAPSERNWAIVDYVTESGEDLVKKKLGWEETAAERPIHPVRPAGAAKYQLILHEDHTEMAYSLESPSSPGSVQETFNILPEAAYIFKIKNPERVAPGYPGVEQRPQYPEELQQLFDEDWINVKDARLLDYENTQILLIGARKQDVEKELGVEFKREGASRVVDKLYKTLSMSEQDHPLKPIVEGEWPETKEAA